MGMSMSQENIVSDAYKLLDVVRQVGGSAMVRPPYPGDIPHDISDGLLKGEIEPVCILRNQYANIDVFHDSYKDVAEILSRTANSCVFCEHEIASAGKVNGRSEDFLREFMADLTGRCSEIYFPIIYLPDIDRDIEIHIEEREPNADIEVEANVFLPLSHSSSLAKVFVSEYAAGEAVALLSVKSTMRKIFVNPFARQENEENIERALSEDYSHLKITYRKFYSCSRSVPKLSRVNEIREKVKKEVMYQILDIVFRAAVFCLAASKELAILDEKFEAAVPTQDVIDSVQKIAKKTDSFDFSSKHSKAASEILLADYKQHIVHQLNTLTRPMLYDTNWLAGFIARKIVMSSFDILDMSWNSVNKYKLLKHLKYITGVICLRDDFRILSQPQNLIPEMVQDERDRRNRTATI